MANATIKRRPRYGDNQRVRGGVAKRSQRRLAALRLDNPGSFKGINPRKITGGQARTLKSKAQALRKKQQTTKKKGPASDKFDPLAPLTGKEFTKELGAKETLAFGDREREQAQAEANQGQTAANTATYYDDYRQALREASARINEANRQNVEQSQARADTAFAQDSAASKQRDEESSRQSQLLGRGDTVTKEGQQAAEAARSQANQRVTGLRERASSDTKYTELRESNSVLAKAQALAREQGRARRLREDRAALEKEEGAFRVNERDKARQSERQYEAIKKEFGLKERQVNIDAKNSRADRALERQKVNAQKIVARIYASADKAGARAQVRVAQLQLKKGRITKNQMRTIRNIYEGLPGGGSANHPDAGTKGGKGGGSHQWGGAVDTPAEAQKADQMYADLLSRNPKPTNRSKIINGAVRNGVPRAAAVKAWRKYMRKRYPHRGSATPRNPDGTPG